MEYSLLSRYDDLLADIFLDGLHLWFRTIKMNADHSERRLPSKQLINIIRNHIIGRNRVTDAAQECLNLDFFKDYLRGVSQKDKSAFGQHMKRYLSMYVPNAGFEICDTRRYSQEGEEAQACVIATKDWSIGDEIKMCSGMIAVLASEDDDELKRQNRDFSVMFSTRKNCSCLFLGPARFMNHDCDSNCKFIPLGQAAITLKVVKDVKCGDELTSFYGDQYFGEDNCECRCVTCERRGNGFFKPPEIEEEIVEEQQEVSARRSTRKRKAVSYEDYFVLTSRVKRPFPGEERGNKGKSTTPKQGLPLILAENIQTDPKNPEILNPHPDSVMSIHFLCGDTEPLSGLLEISLSNVRDSNKKPHLHGKTYLGDPTELVCNMACLTEKEFDEKAAVYLAETPALSPQPDTYLSSEQSEAKEDESTPKENSTKEYVNLEQPRTHGTPTEVEICRVDEELAQAQKDELRIKRKILEREDALFADEMAGFLDDISELSSLADTEILVDVIEAADDLKVPDTAACVICKGPIDKDQIYSRCHRCHRHFLIFDLEWPVRKIKKLPKGRNLKGTKPSFSEAAVRDNLKSYVHLPGASNRELDEELPIRPISPSPEPLPRPSHPVSRTSASRRKKASKKSKKSKTNKRIQPYLSEEPSGEGITYIHSTDKNYQPHTPPLITDHNAYPHSIQACYNSIPHNSQLLAQLNVNPHSGTSTTNSRQKSRPRRQQNNNQDMDHQQSNVENHHYTPTYDQSSSSLASDWKRLSETMGLEHLSKTKSTQYLLNDEQIQKFIDAKSQAYAEFRQYAMFSEKYKTFSVSYSENPPIGTQSQHLVTEPPSTYQIHTAAPQASSYYPYQSSLEEFQTFIQPKHDQTQSNQTSNQPQLSNFVQSSTEPILTCEDMSDKGNHIKWSNQNIAMYNSSHSTYENSNTSAKGRGRPKGSFAKKNNPDQKPKEKTKPKKSKKSNKGLKTAEFEITLPEVYLEPQIPQYVIEQTSHQMHGQPIDDPGTHIYSTEPLPPGVPRIPADDQYFSNCSNHISVDPSVDQQYLQSYGPQCHTPEKHQYMTYSSSSSSNSIVDMTQEGGFDNQKNPDEFQMYYKSIHSPMNYRMLKPSTAVGFPDRYKDELVYGKYVVNEAMYRSELEAINFSNDSALRCAAMEAKRHYNRHKAARFQAYGEAYVVGYEKTYHETFEHFYRYHCNSLSQERRGAGQSGSNRIIRSIGPFITRR